ncbi:MAG: radical SAM protein [Spirochaetaceae bacterium]|jgi:organic radical activating enzyme|nr:radical SAM protein [Spirochaetaceae bacterium]
MADLDSEKLILGKLTIIITTRCNLRCKLCCESVPQYKPFKDMTLEEEREILDAAFNILDRVEILHLSGGGEPFLHPLLPEMIDIAMSYSDKFDKFMVFTNSTVPISDKLMFTLKKYRKNLLVHASQYNVRPEKEAVTFRLLAENGINHRIIKYFGDEQDFGGWVDFGNYRHLDKSGAELDKQFKNCAVIRDMHGNWRTRDGTLHLCTISQRGNELGLIKDNKDDFVDMLDKNSSVQEKREKLFRLTRLQGAAPGRAHLKACEYCTGDHGTDDASKRHPAAEQEG